MKLVIVLGLIAAACAGPAGSGQEIPILKYAQDGVNPDGSYSWSYETGNGIAAQEQGQPKSPEILAAQGAYKFTSPEGLNVAITYIADENGFQPQGDSIPVPPPIPDAILKSLQWNEAHPNEGDEGQGQSYKPQQRG